MARRYSISVSPDESGGYNIEHEADAVLFTYGPGLAMGDPEAKLAWEPYRELLPEVMDIPDATDPLAEDEGNDFGYLNDIDTDPDRWPGASQFWYDVRQLHLRNTIVDLGNPGAGSVYRIAGNQALREIVERLSDKYDFSVDLEDLEEDEEEDG